MYLCIYVVHLAKCCIIVAVYVWFIWLSIALLQQCMYVVHLAKCCIIGVVYISMYVCMNVVHLTKCCIIATVYVCGSSS